MSPYEIKNLTGGANLSIKWGDTYNVITIIVSTTDGSAFTLVRKEITPWIYLEPLSGTDSNPIKIPANIADVNGKITFSLTNEDYSNLKDGDYKLELVLSYSFNNQAQIGIYPMNSYLTFTIKPSIIETYTPTPDSTPDYDSGRVQNSDLNQTGPSL